MAKIKIYSFDPCPYCANLESFLKKNGFSFERIDIFSNKNSLPEFFKNRKEISVPIIEINGKIIEGFKKEEIKKALGIK